MNDREEQARQRREANARHRAAIDQEIFNAIRSAVNVSADDTRNLINAIVAGKIPHVRIEY